MTASRQRACRLGVGTKGTFSVSGKKNVPLVPPGLLRFREAPAVVPAVRKLRTVPDLFLLDAQGLAHPRRLGLASHVGLLMDHSTVGCAKSPLCGEHDEPASAAGSASPLIHRGEQVGVVLRTCTGVKPVYVSVGHRVTLDDAIQAVLTCVTRYRLPEPTRLAHILVTRHRRDD
jgi:deoxyribonuclease V